MIKLIHVCKRFSEMYGEDPLWVNAAGCLAFSSILDTSDYDFALGINQEPNPR